MPASDQWPSSRRLETTFELTWLLNGVGPDVHLAYYWQVLQAWYWHVTGAIPPKNIAPILLACYWWSSGVVLAWGVPFLLSTLYWSISKFGTSLVIISIPLSLPQSNTFNSSSPHFGFISPHLYPNYKFLPIQTITPIFPSSHIPRTSTSTHLTFPLTHITLVSTFIPLI